MILADSWTESFTEYQLVAIFTYAFVALCCFFASVLFLSTEKGRQMVRSPKGAWVVAGKTLGYVIGRTLFWPIAAIIQFSTWCRAQAW